MQSETNVDIQLPSTMRKWVLVIGAIDKAEPAALLARLVFDIQEETDVHHFEVRRMEERSFHKLYLVAVWYFELSTPDAELTAREHKVREITAKVLEEVSRG